MKVMYNIKPIRGQYNSDEIFTYRKEYQVIADYRKRTSEDGFVVNDNTGQVNMLLPKDVIIIQDYKSCYTFENKNN
jgi:hypothetical protein